MQNQGIFPRIGIVMLTNPYLGHAERSVQIASGSIADAYLQNNPFYSQAKGLIKRMPQQTSGQARTSHRGMRREIEYL